MVQYYGDFAEDATVYIPFNTFTSDDPAASSTITNLAAGDVHVHKDGSTTQATTNGATVSIDFDTVTGNHLITIDTSADAYYATGSDYLVRIEGTTVDGATINAWIGVFSIENRTTFPKADMPTNFTDLSITASTGRVDVASIAGTAQTARDIGASVLLSSGTGTGQVSLSSGTVTVGTNNDKTGYSISGTLTTLDALNDPTAAAIADAVLDEALSGHVTAGTLGKAVADIETDATAILADTNELQTNQGDWATATGFSTHSAADVRSEMDSNSTQLAAILTDTGTTLPATLATIDGIVDDLKSGIIFGSAATGTLSTTQASTNLTGYADDQLIGRIVTWLSGNCEGESSDITDYASTGGVLTFTALTTAPANGDKFKIT